MLRKARLGLALAVVGSTVLGCQTTRAGLSLTTPWADARPQPLRPGTTFRTPITIATRGRLVRGTVEAVVQHPDPGQFRLGLLAPSGANLELAPFLNDGGDQRRYALPLLAFQGEEVMGTWTLTATTGVEGTLVAWGIELERVESGP